jgi:hypothetical protein
LSLLGLSLLTALAGAAPERGHDLVVPGGLRGLVAAAGLDPGTERGRVLPALVRRLHPPNGPSAPELSRVLAHLEGGLRESEEAETLALPVAREFWDRVVFPRALPDTERQAWKVASRNRLSLNLVAEFVTDFLLARGFGEVPHTLGPCTPVESQRCFNGTGGLHV